MPKKTGKKKSTFKKLGRSKRTIRKFPQHFRPSHPEPTLVDPIVDEIRDGKVVRNIIKFAKARKLPDVEAKYWAIVGCDAYGQLVASNLVEQAHLDRAITVALKKLRKEPNFEFGIQLERFPVVPGSRVEMSIKDIRSASQVYPKAGVSSVSCLNFVDVPLEEDTNGFGIMPVMASILFGSGIKRDIAMWQTMRKSRAKAPVATIEWIEASDKAQFAHAVKQVFSPPLVGAAMSCLAAKEAGVEDWMKTAGKRAFVKLQMLSMLPIKKRVDAAGRGAQMLAPALQIAKIRVDQGRRAGPPELHPDELLHFWFDELRRLGLDDVRLPLIKLR